MEENELLQTAQLGTHNVLRGSLHNVPAVTGVQCSRCSVSAVSYIACTDSLVFFAVQRQRTRQKYRPSRHTGLRHFPALPTTTAPGCVQQATASSDQTRTKPRYQSRRSWRSNYQNLSRCRQVRRLHHLSYC